MKARHFNSTKRFIGDLDGGDGGGEFGRPICEMYPKERKLKVEHQGDYATFFNLNITIKKGNLYIQVI